MAENSKIEWTDHTFNPWVGCTKISPACDHCYAEGWAKRAGSPELWAGKRRRTSATNWKQPIKWNREAENSGVRRKVFCASLADVFDNQAEPEWRSDLWAIIKQTPLLNWQLLTKRPQNIAKMLPLDWSSGYPNVWLGTTAESQEEADKRIPHLVRAPARVRFVSYEPALSGVNFAPWLADIHWIIAGGESGPGARPFNPDWARSVRDQCARAGIAFFMKQMGGVRKPFAPIPDDLVIRQFPDRTGGWHE